VTVPLLGAGWYDAEVSRRNPDFRAAFANPNPARSIADAARSIGRPVLAALTLEPVDRTRLNGCWTVIGFSLLDDGKTETCQTKSSKEGSMKMTVDQDRTARWLKQFGSRSVQSSVRASTDPVGEYFATLLRCPGQLLDSARKNGRRVSLDSTCNP
jgi:hypothetical protein